MNLEIRLRGRKGKLINDWILLGRLQMLIHLGRVLLLCCTDDQHIPLEHKVISYGFYQLFVIIMAISWGWAFYVN